MLVGLIAQSIKPFFNRQWYASINNRGKRLPRYGGMPSAHTAFIFSLATVIAATQGFSSPAFAIAAVLVVVILDDALRMRIFLGRYGAALRQLIAKLPSADQREFPYVESRLGHKTTEVVAGAFLGVGLTLLILFLLG